MFILAFVGVTNCQLDGVIAYYPTIGANCDELSMLLARLLIEIPKKTSVTIIGVVCKLAIKRCD